MSVALGPRGTAGPKLPLWNTIAGAKSADATMVVVQMSGPPNAAFTGAPSGNARYLLRLVALEGKLPAYDQLDASSAYEGGAFAYLAGSAFLEWLVAKHGNSSLVDVWRRLSAKQTRSFDEAFTGVFGESPRTLYARYIGH